MALQTAFTARFGCRYPIVQAPMAGVAGGKLAAAVARAGGYPFIAAGHADNLEALSKEVAMFKTEAPVGTKWGLGIISYSALGINKALSKLLQFEPDVLQFVAPPLYTDSIVRECHAAGIKVMVTCNTLKEAVMVADAGVDAIIAQGSEGGGHSVRLGHGRATLALAAAVTKELKGRDIQILCAGGIVDGRGLIAGLALGCSGVVMGTRFWACKEALGNRLVQERLKTASGDETIRTRVFDMVNAVLNEPYGWPAPYDTVRAVANDFTDKWHNHEAELEEELKRNGASSQVAMQYKAALQAGDTSTAVCYAGEGLDLVKSIDSAEEIIKNIVAEAKETLQMLSKLA